MAHSVSIHRPRKRKPARFVEERPVLQLPLRAPEWQDPPNRERVEPDADRGVAVIDFFI